jgi:hypothetical protein
MPPNVRPWKRRGIRNGTEERQKAAGQKAPAGEHTTEDGAVGSARDRDDWCGGSEEAQRISGEEGCGGEEGADSDTKPGV